MRRGLLRRMAPALGASLSGVALLLLPAAAHAQKIENILGSETISDRPMVLMSALAALAMLPLLVLMMTCFVKIAVVLTILRQGLGLQQIPPTIVLTGLSMMMTAYIMAPVALESYHTAQDSIVAAGIQGEITLRKIEPVLIEKIMEVTQIPLRDWLVRNTHPEERAFFFALGKELRPPRDAEVMTDVDYAVLTPAFVMTELKEAFFIGFMMYLPLLVIDMVVANVLMALGMQMLSPTTVSVPFKLLCFTAADGWYVLAKGLSITYV